MIRGIPTPKGNDPAVSPVADDKMTRPAGVLLVVGLAATTLRIGGPGASRRRAAAAAGDQSSGYRLMRRPGRGDPESAHLAWVNPLRDGLADAFNGYDAHTALAQLS